MGKRLWGFLFGTSDHGFALKRQCLMVPCLQRCSVMLRLTLVSDTRDWLDKSMVRQSYGGPCSSQLMPFARSRQKHSEWLVALMQKAEGISYLLTSTCLSHGVPQLCYDLKTVISLRQRERTWRTKTLVTKMCAILLHLQTRYIPISHIETTKMSADTKFLDPNPTLELHRSIIKPIQPSMSGTFSMTSTCLETLGSLAQCFPGGHYGHSDAKKEHEAVANELCFIWYQWKDHRTAKMDYVIYHTGHNICSFFFVL